MAYEDLLLEKEGGLATITLNAPEKLNALSREMRRSIFLATDEVAKDDEVRVIIVTGAGRGFCAGADLSGPRVEPPRYERHATLGEIYRSDAFFKLDKPVIAAINGPCVGAGLSLALSMDIRIASETARFGVSQVARALVPDLALTYWLPKVVGMSKALELMFTAEIIGADQAEQLGIVSQVVPPDELMKVARELASRIAQQAPFSVELAKRMVYRGTVDDVSRQDDLETWAQEICRQTEDHKESVRAFLEKQPQPQFKGR